MGSTSVFDFGLSSVQGTGVRSHYRRYQTTGRRVRTGSDVAMVTRYYVIEPHGAYT